MFFAKKPILRRNNKWYNVIKYIFETEVTFMTETIKTEILVVGSGPAGFSAAYTAAKKRSAGYSC